MLDLYDRTWDGEPLGADDYVISADEKTSIQARCRCHPTLPAGKARQMRVNHDYHRRGAVAYLAAYDVHRGKVFGRCEDTTGIEPFTRLVDQVMTQEPYASADRVFWIVDNGSSHRGKAAIDRLAEQYPNAIMVHTPVHASWLNQIEIYFSIIQRKVLSPNDFTDIDVISERLAAFENRYNKTAKPFTWKFTTTDLTDLLARLDNCTIRAQAPTRPTPCRMTPDELTGEPTKYGDPLAALDYATLAIRNYHDAGNSAMIRSPLVVLADFFDRLGRYEPATTLMCLSNVVVIAGVSFFLYPAAVLLNEVQTGSNRLLSL